MSDTKEMRETDIYKRTEEYHGFLFDKVVFRHEPFNEEETILFERLREFIDEVLFINEGLVKLRDLELWYKRFNKEEA